MEINCTRCHQAIEEDACYCPACGLPHLVYASDGATGPAPAEPGIEPVRDAGSVAWKPAIRYAILLSVPAGMLSSFPSPLSEWFLVWMALAALWTVMLYVRSERPAWITIGAGTRIGLVFGILASWITFSINGAMFCVQRFFFHQPGMINDLVKAMVDSMQQRAQQSMAGMSAADAAQAQAMTEKLLQGIQLPEGHAWVGMSLIVTYSLFMLFAALAGGALGARMVARRRQREI